MSRRETFFCIRRLSISFSSPQSFLQFQPNFLFYFFHLTFIQDFFIYIFQPNLEVINQIVLQALEEEEKMTPEQLAIKNVGKLDPKRHLEEKVLIFLEINICINILFISWFIFFVQIVVYFYMLIKNDTAIISRNCRFVCQVFDKTKYSQFNIYLLTNCLFFF